VGRVFSATEIEEVVLMRNRLWLAVWAIPLLFPCGCGPSSKEPGGEDSTTIRVEGSDTMVNLAQAWAETYHEKHPDVSVQVLGGGSGVGIASLTNGTCEMANASRKMKPKEVELAKQKLGVEPVEFIVGYDALAVYVHKDNPLDSISIEELAEIYGDGGTITNWSQLEGGRDAEITRVSRQNSSGTYFYFREAVLGEGREYKLGTVDMSGSKDVVALVSSTPSAIGYSGMGYATDEVKMLKISPKKGEPGVAPTVENAKSGAYPITRPLYIYTPGEPEGIVKEFLDWIRAPEGQAVVIELGYVPASDHE
jgi:phosphate transport system substrate-binding protein